MSRRMRSKLARWEREVRPDSQAKQILQLTKAELLTGSLEPATTPELAKSARRSARKARAKAAQECLPKPTQFPELNQPIPKQPKQRQPKSSKKTKNVAQAQERKQRKRVKRAERAWQGPQASSMTALPLRPASVVQSPLVPLTSGLKPQVSTSPVARSRASPTTVAKPRVWLSTVARSTTRRIDPNYETRAFADDFPSSGAMDESVANQAATYQAEENAYQAAVDAEQAEEIANVEDEDEQADAWCQDWQRNNLVGFFGEEGDMVV